MKTILPCLLFIFLASCSQPPPSSFKPYGEPRHEPVFSATPQTAHPAHSATPQTATPQAARQPVTPTVDAITPAASVSATNATLPSMVDAGPTTVPSPSPLRSGPPETATAETNAHAPAARVSEEIIPAGTINFPATDLNQVLQIYSELVNRTVLRPANLPAPLITLKTQTPLTKKEAIQAFDAVLAMNGITMINVGDKFVKAVPTTQANQEGAPFSKLDSSQLPEVGQYVTHVVQLKYVRPSDLVTVLQPFAKIPASILAIDTSQILVLRDFAENVKRMLEMIKEIDVSVPSEYLSEVIPIKYAKAGDIQEALNSLTTGGGGGGTSIGHTSGAAPRAAGGALGGMRSGVGGLNNPQAGQTTPGSVPGQPGAQTPSFTDRLRGILKSAGGGAGDLQIIGTTKIIADERSNSLLIFATRPDMDMIKSIIAKLDVVLAQVLIETTIIDVQLDNNWNFGISGGQNAPKQFSTTPPTAGAGGYNNGQQLIDLLNSAATNAFSLASISGGFTYWGALGKNLDVALQAAANDSRVNVLQKPQIITTHATPASIFIGSTVPYITSTYYNSGYGGGPSSAYQQLQVGIGLTVTPYINSDGLVVMQIDETIDELSSSSTAIQGVGNVPNTVNRRLTAEVAVRDGDTIMLGGFIRNSDSKANSGVPLLRDIPLLGALFSTKSDTKSRSELIVLMRPTVMLTPESVALATAREKKKMPGVISAEEDVQRQDKKDLENVRKEEMKNFELQQKQAFKEETPVTPEEKKLYGTP